MVNVLVTGAGGFIGSHLAEECVRQGYKVKAFLRYNSKNDWGWLENKFVQTMERTDGGSESYTPRS